MSVSAKTEKQETRNKNIVFRFTVIFFEATPNDSSYFNPMNTILKNHADQNSGKYIK